MKSLARVFLTFFLALTIAVPPATSAPMFRYKALYFEDDQTSNREDEESEEQEIPDVVVVPGVEPTVTIVDPSSGGTIITTVGAPFSLTYEVTNANAVSSVGSFPPGMIIDVNSRGIVGTPSVSGTYSFNMKAYARVDGEVLTGDSNTVTVEVVEPFSIVTSGVADMFAGEAFSISLTSTRSNVTYQVNGLADWMTFENGVVSGSNAEVGTVNIQVLGQTPEGDIGRGSVTVVVTEHPNVSYDEGFGVVGEAFSLDPVTEGGKLTFTPSTGSLPPGLDLSSNGTITGTPTQTGTYQFSVNAGRSTEFADFGPFTIRVGEPLRVSGAEVENTYNGGEIVVAEQPSASGGYTPYTWSVLGFPGTVVIDPDTGVISGDQGTEAQSVSATVVVEDATGRIARKSVNYEILDPQVNVEGTRDAMVGVSYVSETGAPVQAKVSGGVAAYFWTLAGQPSWISIDSDTGILSGTPTATGDVEFDVRAEDSNGIIAETTVAFTVIPELGINDPVFGPTDIDDPLVVVTQPSAFGGDGDYSWRFGDQKISWMTIDPATGVLSGTRANVPGDTITIVVEDGAGYQAETLVSIDLGTGLSISAPEFETAYVNEAVVVAEQPTVSGGLAPYVWSIDAVEPNDLGVSINPATGALTVPTSTETGEYEFTIAVTDQNAFTTTLTAAIMFNGRLSMTPPVVGLGMVNRDLYVNQQASATGGVEPLTWTSPDAPAWLQIGATTGGLSGQPAAEMDGGFTLTVSDAAGESASEWVPLRVLEELIVTAHVFGDTAHSQAVVVTSQPSASGGEEPYSWEITQGPEWLTLSPEGLISGTAGTSYDGDVTVQVTEANGFTAEASAALQVTDALRIIPPVIPAQNVGYELVVTSQVSAQGGVGSYSWSIENRPSWMTFDEVTGSLAGMPSETGAYPFSITVNDEIGAEASVEVVVTVGVTDLELTGPQFGTTITGLFVEVDQQPSAAGGIEPYVFMATGNPAWLDIDPDTGELGGVAGDIGSYSFSVGVQDANGAEAWVTTTLDVTSTISVSSFPSVEEFQIIGGPFAVIKNGSVEGGDGTYNWSLTNNPGWLSIGSASGILSGTVGDTGQSDVTVSVEDGGGDAASGDFSFTAVDGLSIEGPEASYLVRNDPIVVDQQPVAVGGLPPFAWALENGPSWLNIDPSSGALSGTPDADQTYDFNLVLEDGSNQNASLAVTWEIFSLGIEGPIVVGTVGEELEVAKQPVATGGDGSYTWLTTDAPAWLTLSSNGTLTGVPTNSGTVSFLASVSDGSGTTVSDTFEFEVRPALILSAPVIPLVQEQNAVLAVTTQPAVTGGSGVYSWSVTGGPAGMVIDDETGALSGTLTTAFDGTFTVGVTDDEGRSDTVDVDLTVIENLQIASASLGSVQTRTEDLAVTAQPTASGGVEPYTWSVADAPTWLDLNQSSGELSGVIDAAETFSFTLTVTDADGRTADVSLGGTSKDPIVMSAAVFGNSVVDEALIIDDQPGAAGGQAPYSWAIAASPSFLNIDEVTGELSGSTSIGQEGAYSAQITVTDAEGRSDTQNVSFNVYDIMALTQGVASVAYENVEIVFDNQPSITGGKAPYSWGMSGNPTWLNIDMDTGELSGTPTAQGTFNFDLEVIDDAGRFAAVSMSIFVQPEPSSYDEFSLAQTISGEGSEQIAISNDGSTMVVGHTASDTSGEILIYEKQNGQMVLAAQLNAPVSTRYFGYAVDISGDGSTIAVTNAPASSSLYGGLFIYKKVAGSWINTQHWNDKYSTYQSYDNFGYQVAVDYDGDTVAVGSRLRWGSYTALGAVFMFEDNAGSLVLENVVRSSTSGNYSFGAWFDLEIDDAGETVVGHLGQTGGAIAYFKKLSGSWPVTAWGPYAPGTSSNNRGRAFAVSPDGQRLAYYQEAGPDGVGNTGSLQVRDAHSNGITWETNGEHFTSNDAFASDLFGYSVDFGKDNNEIITSARSDDDRGGNTGSVYVFQLIDDNWVQMQKIIPDDIGSGDLFGTEVIASADGSTFVASGGGNLYIYTR